MENSLSQCSVMVGSLNSSSDGMFCSSVSSLYSCVFAGFAPLSLLFAFALVLWASLAVLGWLFAGTAACLCSFFLARLFCCPPYLVGAACVGGMQDSLRPGVGRPRGRYAPRFVVLDCSVDRPSKKKMCLFGALYFTFFSKNVSSLIQCRFKLIQKRFKLI